LLFFFSSTAWRAEETEEETEGREGGFPGGFRAEALLAEALAARLQMQALMAELCSVFSSLFLFSVSVSLLCFCVPRSCFSLKTKTYFSFPPKRHKTHKFFLEIPEFRSFWRFQGEEDSR
jgi:hypothetical protein